MEIEIENPALKKVVANEAMNYSEHFKAFQSFLREVIHPEVVAEDAILKVHFNEDGSCVVEVA